MSQVMTGARGLVSIHGHISGFVSGVNVTVEDTLTDVDVMGQIAVGDLAETAHKCNFTVNYFKPMEPDAGAFVQSNLAKKVAGKEENITSAAALGIDSSFIDSGNGDVSTGANIQSMRTQKYFTCQILDDVTGLVIFVMEGCKYQGGSGQADARGVWAGVWNFKALRGYGV